MKVSMNKKSIKQKEIVKVTIFSMVLGGYVLYKAGYALGELIYQISL